MLYFPTYLIPQTTYESKEDILAVLARMLCGIQRIYASKDEQKLLKGLQRFLCETTTSLTVNLIYIETYRRTIFSQ